MRITGSIDKRCLVNKHNDPEVMLKGRFLRSLRAELMWYMAQETLNEHQEARMDLIQKTLRG